MCVIIQYIALILNFVPSACYFLIIASVHISIIQSWRTYVSLAMTPLVSQKSVFLFTGILSYKPLTVWTIMATYRQDGNDEPPQTIENNSSCDL